MEDQNSNNNRDSDEALDRLITEAGKLSNQPFNRPSDAEIDAYLLGSATNAQKETVQSALRASSDFRKKMLALAGDLDRLNDPELRRAFDTLKIEPMPNLNESSTRLGRGKFSLKNAGVNTTNKPRFVRSYIRPVPVLSAVAIVVLAVVVYNRLSSPGGKGVPTPLNQESSSIANDKVLKTGQLATTSLKEISSSVPPEAFSEFSTRGGKVHPKDLSRWEDSTALEAISKCLEMDPANYLYHAIVKKGPGELPVAARQVIVRLVNTSGQAVVILPLETSTACGSCSLWILGLPGGSRYPLFSAPMIGDTVNVSWKKTMGTEGIVTLTYKVGHQFRASHGSTFKF